MSEIEALRAEIADLRWQLDGAVDQAAALLVERDDLRDRLSRVAWAAHCAICAMLEDNCHPLSVQQAFDEWIAARNASGVFDTTQDNNTGPGKAQG